MVSYRHCWWPAEQVRVLATSIATRRASFICTETFAAIHCLPPAFRHQFTIRLVSCFRYDGEFGR